MEFSVLMSVYNKENAKFFDRALESNLTLQSVKPNQFVIVCDGPLTDELDEVLRKYKALYPNIVETISLETNVGLGQALKIGLEHCNYEIVARSDSDDICVPTRFEKQLLYLSENPDIDVLSSHISEFDHNPEIPLRKKVLPLYHEEIVKMAKFRNPINHMAVMFKKSKILEAGSYIHLPYVEDYYLWVRAINTGCRLANFDEVLVNARVGNGMEKRRSNRKYISSWKELTKYMRENKMISAFTATKNMFSVRVFIYMTICLKSWLYKYILRSN